jgi:hypothetical protein
MCAFISLPNADITFCLLGRRAKSIKESKEYGNGVSELENLLHFTCAVAEKCNVVIN